MQTAPALAALFFLAGPAAQEPRLVANADGSITLTQAIESPPPAFVLEPLPRPIRNAGRVRARNEARAETDRAFLEATAQAREAARVPRPR